ncbi:hypothetical protein Mapa_010570 [Marchantia paleacea]|nr:hypothetical protein Mapa_010570 [Marchantia paleacea]
MNSSAKTQLNKHMQTKEKTEKYRGRTGAPTTEVRSPRFLSRPWPDHTQRTDPGDVREGGPSPSRCDPVRMETPESRVRTWEQLRRRNYTLSFSNHSIQALVGYIRNRRYGRLDFRVGVQDRPDGKLTRLFKI